MSCDSDCLKRMYDDTPRDRNTLMLDHVEFNREVGTFTALYKLRYKHLTIVGQCDTCGEPFTVPRKTWCFGVVEEYRPSATCTCRNSKMRT